MINFPAGKTPHTGLSIQCHCPIRSVAQKIFLKYFSNFQWFMENIIYLIGSEIPNQPINEDLSVEFCHL